MIHLQEVILPQLIDGVQVQPLSVSAKVVAQRLELVLQLLLDDVVDVELELLLVSRRARQVDVGIELLAHPLLQRLGVELLVLRLRHRLLDQLDDEVLDEIEEVLLLVLPGDHLLVPGLLLGLRILGEPDEGNAGTGGEDFLAHSVDRLALLVHHVVVLEEVLADVEVLSLDPLLRALDGLRQPGMLDGLVLLDAERLHQLGNPIRGEDPHQVVFQAHVELGGARIALPAAAAAKLVVDAPRLVPLGTEDVQAAGRDHLLVLLRAVVLVLANRGVEPCLPLPVEPRELGLHLRRGHRREFRFAGLLGLGDALLHEAAFDLVRGRLRPHLAAGEELWIAAEEDVGAAAGHVGGNGDAPLAPGLRDDLRLALVLLGVQDVMGNAALLEELREHLALRDGHRADQHRLPLLVLLLDLVADGGELLPLRLVDGVLLVLADVLLVGGDDEDFELVDAAELLRLGIRGSGHAGNLGVEAEVVLERDRGEGLVLVLDLDVLLRLHGLVETVRPAPARHQASGEVVDDDYLAFLHHVLVVLAVKRVRPQGLLDVMERLDLLRVVEIRNVELRLHLLDAIVGEDDGAGLLVDGEVAIADEAGNDLVDDVVLVGRLLGGAADDERRARLVDEDGVDLVDDRVVKLALHVVGEPELHVVAQIIEAELVVLPVGDVGAVLALALAIAEPVNDAADAQAHRPIEPAHPLGVALRQVVVHGDDVDALPLERVEDERQGGDERLAFARLHLGDVALVERHPAEELDVEVAHPENAHAHLTGEREAVRQDAVERRVLVLRRGVRDLLLPGADLLADLLVGKAFRVGLALVDAPDEGLHLAQLALVLRADHLLDDVIEH